MTIIRATFGAAVITALIAGATQTTTAHHSFAPFNLSAEKTLVGVVKAVDWTNPHTWIWIDVANDKGVVQTWGVEGMSPNYLARRGWTRTTFKPGDKVTIVVRPLRDGSTGGMFVRATLPDGKELTFAGGEPTDR